MVTIFRYQDVPQDFWGHVENIFYSQPWLKVLQRQYQYDFFVTYNTENHNYAIFALVKGLTGTKFVNLPFSDYTRPKIENVESYHAFIDKLNEVFPGVPVISKVTWITKVHQQPGKLMQRATLHRVDTTSASLIDANMTPAFRRGVRKAKEAGLVFSISSTKEAVEEFYDLYYQFRIEKLELIPQSWHFFEYIFEEFFLKELGFVAKVQLGDKTIAAALVLKHKEELFYKWGCSAMHYLSYRPNNLLFYELLHWSYEQGFTCLDLGLSDLHTDKNKNGLIRFKRQMGGVESFIYTYQFLPQGCDLQTEKKLKSILNDMANIVAHSGFDQKTTSNLSESIYPLFV